MVKAGLEGGIVAALACGALRLGLTPIGHPALGCEGLGLAWVASTAGTLILAFGLRYSRHWFWRAFGLGIFLRAGVLAGLMALAWGRPLAEAEALLGGYVLGVAVMMLLEFRHLVRRGT